MPGNNQRQPITLHCDEFSELQIATYMQKNYRTSEAWWAASALPGEHFIYNDAKPTEGENQ